MRERYVRERNNNLMSCGTTIYFLSKCRIQYQSSLLFASSTLIFFYLDMCFMCDQPLKNNSMQIMLELENVKYVIDWLYKKMVSG